jgi:hypothetical protein
MEINSITTTSRFNPSPSRFISGIFIAKAYGLRKTLKRSQSSVNRWASEAALVKEATEMGMQVLKMCGEYILYPKDESILCLTSASNEHWNWQRISPLPERVQDK